MMDNQKVLDQSIGDLYSRFKEFKDKYIGTNGDTFRTTPLNTSNNNGYGNAVYNLQKGQHSLTGLIPFMLPKTIHYLPQDINQFEVLQYYIDGIASLIVARVLDKKSDKENLKTIRIYLALASFMVKDLDNAFKGLASAQPQLQQQNQYLIDSFNSNLDGLNQLLKFIFQNDLPQTTTTTTATTTNNQFISPALLHIQSIYLFSLLHSGYWTLHHLSDQQKLLYSDQIYACLRQTVAMDPKIALYKYSLGTFCYSFFKLHQIVANVSSLKFFNFNKEKSIDHSLYSKMNGYLRESYESYTLEFEREPIHHPEFWFIYAKTCCLLNMEEKSQRWIQLFINDAPSRIEIAKVVKLDQDMTPYHQKSWYIEIMNSIEEEEKKQIQIQNQLKEIEYYKQLQIEKEKEKQANIKLQNQIQQQVQQQPPQHSIQQNNVNQQQQNIPTTLNNIPTTTNTNTTTTQPYLQQFVQQQHLNNTYQAYLPQNQYQMQPPQQNYVHQQNNNMPHQPYIQQFVQQPQHQHLPNIQNNHNQYQELKQNLIIDGYAPKYMNNDSMLISSVILLSLNQVKQEEKEAEIAKKRLTERLELYFLKNSKEIPGDGNCQMHALSDQIYGDLNHSQEIRKTIVDWLRKNKDFVFPNGATLSQFVNGSWDDYCNEMSKSGIWGDHLTLLAAAEIYKAKISIISSVESTSHFFIEIVPSKIDNPKVFLLSHYSEFHYGSLVIDI